MNDRQRKLYAALCEMQITPHGVDVSFESRLAKENGWDLAQTIEVVSEYRRFLFLMLEAGHPVTPSDAVDQAWHLHLLYTDSYWNDLCGRIASRPLHHGPTAGGAAEKDKFTDWYEKLKLPGSRKSMSRKDSKPLPAKDVAMSVALFGIAAVGSQYLDPTVSQLLIRDKSVAWGDGNWTSGGSTGCGGGGDGGGGGGCGGGGCGGCGGGGD